MINKIIRQSQSFDFQTHKLKTIYIDSADDTLLPVSVIGNGEPVLMLAAFGMDARQFLPFILPLINQYQFYLPHFRGFGLADNLTLPQFDFIEQYASDTEQVIDYIIEKNSVKENASDKIAVAGISMGALMMWAYFKCFGTSKISHYLNIDQAPIVHNQPDWQGGVFGARQTELFAQFERLIADAEPYMSNDDRQNTNFRHLPYSLKVGLLKMERSFSLLSVSRKHSQLIVNAVSHQAPHKMALMNHATWQHKLRCLSAYVELPYDYRDVLSTVNIPVTLLIGGRSKLYDPDCQLQLAEMLPNAKVEVLANSGHAIPMDAPIGFYQALKGFLQKN